jgi:hypothetical protein
MGLSQNVPPQLNNDPKVISFHCVLKNLRIYWLQEHMISTPRSFRSTSGFETRHTR